MYLYICTLMTDFSVYIGTSTGTKFNQMKTIKSCAGSDLSEMFSLLNRMNSELKSYSHLENLKEYNKLQKLIKEMQLKASIEYDKREEEYY